MGKITEKGFEEGEEIGHRCSISPKVRNYKDITCIMPLIIETVGENHYQGLVTEYVLFES